jgi:hypothetical protein
VRHFEQLKALCWLCGPPCSASRNSEFCQQSANPYMWFSHYFWNSMNRLVVWIWNAVCFPARQEPKFYLLNFEMNFVIQRESSLIQRCKTIFWVASINCNESTIFQKCRRIYLYDVTMSLIHLLYTVAKFLYPVIYVLHYIPRYVSRNTMLIFRRSKLYFYSIWYRSTCFVIPDGCIILIRFYFSVLYWYTRFACSAVHYLMFFWPYIIV